ncbi:MAG: penicillin-binding protein [Lachnospiraceae bacterium]|nr:penicillin-binding protein [Lachnospiraceae bacterium]
MFDRLKDKLLNMILCREFLLILALFLCAGIMLYRIFDLQIVHGEEYQDSFVLMTKKERSISAARGNIYDRNGNLLAYNELAYFVTIEDVYESGSSKNVELNDTIYRLIKMIEYCGDDVVSDFNIYVNKNNEYEFTVSDNSLLRFLADIYGHPLTSELTYKEKSSTAEDVVNYLCDRTNFGIGTYTDPDDKKSFVPQMGYTKSEVIKMLTIRYAMSVNSYQKYIATTVATDVSERTVAVVQENAAELKGVSVEEDTIRKYNDSYYFSQIIGYTGKVSSTELETLQKSDASYRMNDIVGKAGIENVMETELHGTKGSETLYVDNTGKVQEILSRTEAVAGNDLYLTLDRDLQIAAYNILEQKIAGILVSKIINSKEYNAKLNSTSADIKIPIYDVYFALIDNSVIDTDHFDDVTAGDTEAEVYGKYVDRKASVFAKLREEFYDKKTPYNKLTKEYQNYQSYIVSMITDKGVLVSSLIDREDETYIAWRTEETISIHEYLHYCIAKGWIDTTRLNLEDQYSDSEEIYDHLVDYIFAQLDDSISFTKRLYKYMIQNDVVSGREICEILCEQNLIDIEDDERDKLFNGQKSAYQFMVNRITDLDITPAQLALDPCSGSIVITDVNNGDVLALVSYPSYDNNRMANGVDADYYAKLQNDQSTPLFNFATQERTAPGSTFKMVSATAGLCEGVISAGERINCTGIFTKVDPTQAPKCWIYPNGTHGNLTVSGAIQNSCNYFFYEVGYRLATRNGTYDSEAGLNTLAEYAGYYGLNDRSGVEIEEYAPKVSDEDPVRSAIGQGTNNYTTAQLARYVTTVANSGTCYDLTLLERLCDHNGNLLTQYEPKIRNTMDMMTESQWDAIHSGMKKVVESKSYFADYPIGVAGKTGTAQQSNSRPNHALFVAYAPYDSPEIAIATRIAFGYSSDYAAQTTERVLAYYFHLDEEDEILSGTADVAASAVIGHD